jgi:hypothetical protein
MTLDITHGSLCEIRDLKVQRPISSCLIIFLLVTKKLTIFMETVHTYIYKHLFYLSKSLIEIHMEYIKLRIVMFDNDVV